MPGIIPYTVPWGRTKPPYGTKIDRKHPLVSGMLGKGGEVWAFNEGAGKTVYGAVNGNNGTLNGGMTWQGTPYGIGLKMVPGSSQDVSISNTSLFNGLSKLTLVFDIIPAAVDTTQYGIFSKTSQTGSVFLDVITGVFSSGDVFFRVGTSSSTYAYTGTGVLVAGTRNRLACVFDGTQSTLNRLSVYVNDQQKSVTVNGVIPTSTATSVVNPLIGKYYDNGSNIKYFSGTFLGALASASAFGLPQILSLYTDPFGMFQGRELELGAGGNSGLLLRRRRAAA